MGCLGNREGGLGGGIEEGLGWCVITRGDLATGASHGSGGVSADDVGVATCAGGVLSVECCDQEQAETERLESSGEVGVHYFLGGNFSKSALTSFSSFFESLPELLSSSR